MKVSLLGVSGSTRRPSRTAVLVRAIVDAIAARLDLASSIIELADAAPLVLPTLTRAGASTEAEAVIHAIETADILVVGSPVYRASYTGALKHLFDLVHYDALAGKPVVLAATAGSAMHGLAIEHQFRPLFGFFRALSLPTTIYATEADFTDGALSNPAILQRIDRAAHEVAELVTAGARIRPASLAPRRLVPADNSSSTHSKEPAHG